MSRLASKKVVERHHYDKGRSALPVVPTAKAESFASRVEAPQVRLEAPQVRLEAFIAPRPLSTAITTRSVAMAPVVRSVAMAPVSRRMVSAPTLGRTSLTVGGHDHRVRLGDSGYGGRGGRARYVGGSKDPGVEVAGFRGVKHHTIMPNSGVAPSEKFETVLAGNNIWGLSRFMVGSFEADTSSCDLSSMHDCTFVDDDMLDDE